MDQARHRVEARGRIKERIRRKVSGTAERPRLAVFRSLKSIYAQVIDDANGRTIVVERYQGRLPAGIELSAGSLL